MHAARSGARRSELATLVSLPYSLVFYEAPHRVMECVEDLAAVLGTLTHNGRHQALLEEVLTAAASKVAGVLDAIPGMVRRRVPQLTADDIDLIAGEVVKARNTVAGSMVRAGQAVQPVINLLRDEQYQVIRTRTRFVGTPLYQMGFWNVLGSVLSTTPPASAQPLQIGDANRRLALERLREQLSAADLVLWSSSGQAVASAGESRFKLTPERPSPSDLRATRRDRVIASIEGLEEQDGASNPSGLASQPRIKVLALVAAAGFGLQDEPRYLQVSAPLPALLVADALAVQVAHREYQERSLARDGLRRLYIGTLTLTLFLALFGAVLLAVLLGNQLVRPLLMLAAGMRDVARGDLGPKLALSSRDELAGLTRDFAHMTQELSDARQAVQSSMQQVDTARANLQTILDNLTAGVVVLDARGSILSANPGATRILRAPLTAHQWQGLQTVPGLEGFAHWVQQQFDRFLGESAHEQGHWQQSFELRPAHADRADLAHPGGGDHVTLIARGALLPHGEHLLVFDDVSEIISAQRAQAWGEVARRLAHEIKNPLTPIQLSAERLAMKLEGKLEGQDAALLSRSVRIIVDQVDAMKRLVNDFRDYARLPAAQLMPIDLNALISDILILYDPSSVPVQLDLEPVPLVLADAQQVRQVIHNLVQNAQDATPPGAGPVLLQTRLTESGRRVRLTVQDNGPGFPEAILKRAFEPYVTTKSKGTGLGLAVVKKIMDEHGGRIDIGHRLDGDRILGARVSLSFKVAQTQQDEATS
mgnify:CR=1 FL=1